MKTKFYKTSTLKAFLIALLLTLPSVKLSAQLDSSGVPQAWRVADSSLISGSADNREWWKNFNDPVLNSLISKALVQNTDLLTTVARIQQARARYLNAASYFYPALGVDLMPGYEMSNPTMSSGGSVQSAFYKAQLSLSWEVDIFGTIRNNYKAARADFLANQEQRNGVLVSLFSQVASNYINLRIHQQQLQVANVNLESQANVLNIVRSRRDAGLVSDLDVAQAESVYASTKASVPSIQSQINEDLNTLCFLLGLMPGSLDTELSPIGKIPALPDNILVGIPMDVLRQRPDIREAEMQFAGQMYLLKAARAEYYPRFYISGNFGYTTDNISQFGKKDFMTYQIGPTLTWNFFEGLNVRTNVREQQAVLDQTAENFRAKVLTAFSEADNAMYAFRKLQEQELALKMAMESGTRTFNLAFDLYKSGLCDFQSVLDAQRQMLEYENSYVVSQGNTILSLVNIYRSLGGGWQGQ